MSGADRDRVVEALRAEDVARHLGIEGHWRGRWMRSSRCAETDHSSDAFGLARDGHWHCWSCDKGGDLLALLALGEGIDNKTEFPRLLEVAAGIAGVELRPELDVFGLGVQKPAPRARPPRRALPPLRDRIESARRRAAWVWERLYDDGGLPEAYLRSRGLDPAAVMARETIKSTPIRIGSELRDRIERGIATDDTRALWATMGVRKGTHAIVVPVRCVDGRGFVDLRCRRVEPREGQPKIIGMVGNVTVEAAEQGKTRQLVGCYGDPYSIDSDLVVLTEGLMDYLTSLWLWPNAHCVSAVDAGSVALVARHVAAALAARDDESKLLIVEQVDPPRVNKVTGKLITGSADEAINEQPNAATKAAVRLLRSPDRVGWLYCDLPGVLVEGKPVKDLNDLVRAGADVMGMVRWWETLHWNEE